MRAPHLLASLVLCTAAVVVTGEARAAGHAYGQPGPLSVEVKTMKGSTTKVVVPTTGTPAPLIVASHGFLGSSDNQIGWAKHFASYGFVVAVPSFAGGFSPDHAANAQTIEDLVADLTGPDAATYGVLPGKVGLEGHSAGGLASTMAAAAIDPAAIVLFDPVDDDASDGKTAYAKLCTPIVSLFADPSSCNNQSGWKGFASSAKGEIVGIQVTGSTHCDGENAPRSLCSVTCGGAASADRQEVYAHYATAHFLATLKNDAQAAQALTASAVAADAAATPALRKASTCTPSSPDAGGSSSSSSSSSGSTSSGGASSGSSSSSGAVTERAPEQPADATASDGAAQGGCAAASTNDASPAHVLGTLATVGLAIAVARRRRRA